MDTIFAPQNLEIFKQLLVAVLLGSVIGIERSLAHRLAGFRTFALIALGSCLFIVISDELAATLGSHVGFDPSRIASQIVVGLGFLAGGVVVFNHQKLQGLTTGAGMWVSGAIGVAVGFKMYAIAVFVTILTLIIFGIFWRIEKKFLHSDEHHHLE